MAIQFINTALMISAFMAGIIGSGHCVGMCGGIASAISLSIKEKNQKQHWATLLFYNLGRITSYTIAGALIGGVLFTVLNIKESNTLLIYLRLFSALLMFLLALHIGRLWSGITKTEILGQWLWRRLSPIASKLMPLPNAYAAFPLGMLWGWLPCGMVYAALSLSASSGGFYNGAFVMFAFGLGTLPSMLALGGFSTLLTRFFNQNKIRKANALLLILFSLNTGYIAVKQLYSAPMDMNHMHQQNHMDHDNVNHDMKH